MQPIATWDDNVLSEVTRLHRDGKLNYDTPIVDRRVRFPLFKAGRRSHIREFFASGQLRVGTLWDFRRDEHARGISDPTEGINQIIVMDEEGVPTGINSDNNDCYIYSVSEHDNRQDFKKAGYDASFRITGSEFFVEIARSLNRFLAGSSATGVPDPLRELTLARVIYEDSQNFAQEVEERIKLLPTWRAIPPAEFLKPKELAGQREVRARFYPNANPHPDTVQHFDVSAESVRETLGLTPLWPVMLTVPDARQYSEPLWNC